MALALSLYLGLSRVAGPLAGPLLRRRLKRGKEDPDRLGERMGHATLPRPAGRLVWLHGASVGEAVSMMPLVERLLAEGWCVLMTTGTVTSAARAARMLPDGAVHQFVPVDTHAAVARFLDHWRPDLAIWIESELWPRLVTATAARGVPMAWLNARLSEKSVAGWRRFPTTARAVMGAFGVVRTQDHATHDALTVLGIVSEYGGNLKALVPAPPCDAVEYETLARALAWRPTWLAASTHEGEEASALIAHARVQAAHPDALLILAPRHPDRADEIAAKIAAAGMTVAHRSRGEVASADTPVWLADSMGEMGLWYRLAPLVFVGGSLAPRGGHTPFEPIACGAAVLHGPDTRNFAEIYRALADVGGAVEVANGEALGDALSAWMTDPSQWRATNAAAARVHAAARPDLDGVMETLASLAGSKA